MKKAICVIGSVALCAALLAGCGQSGAPAETAADAVKQSASAWLTSRMRTTTDRSRQRSI